MTLMLLLALLTGASGWRDAGPDHAWSFPRDHHARHEYRNEWWYVTGHLAAADANEPTHGFQVTFFRLGIAPEMPSWDSDWAARDLVMAAINDRPFDVAATVARLTEMVDRRCLGPSTACIVQSKLGMTNGKPAFDLQAVCSAQRPVFFCTAVVREQMCFCRQPVMRCAGWAGPRWM